MAWPDVLSNLSSRGPKVKYANLQCSIFRVFVIRGSLKLINNEVIRHGRLSLHRNSKTGHPENEA